jgi:outer membrane protein insertion porin family
MKSISEAKLEKMLTLQEKSRWQKLLFWTKDNQYYEADLISDVEVLKNFYQKEGFLDIAVDSAVEEIPADEAVKVEFKIQENNPVLIKKINYNLQTSETTEKEKLQVLLNKFVKDLALKQGGRFRDEDLLAAKSKLENWLVDQGYAYQKVTYNLDLKKEINRVFIDFNLKPGPVCYFGSASFQGVEDVPYSILEKQLSPPGEKYNELYLQTLQRKLQALGMFQYVTVRSLLQENKDNTIPLQINVKEASRLSFKYGIGYGQEDKIRTSITVTKLGFLGGIRRAVFYAKYSSLEPYNLSLKLTQPAILHPDDAFTINPFARKEDETSYTRSRIGSFLTYQIGLSKYISSYLNYGLEWDNLKTASPSLEDDLIADGKGDYHQSSASIGLVFDNSQPMFSPQSGWYFASALTWVGMGFNSDYHYTMLTSEVRKYTLLYKELVLASRLEGGFMKSLRANEVTPIADRFNAGGSTSIRGWARYDLGPKSEDNLSLGGNSIIESSVELRYPIWNIVSGVVFCDAGNVWSATYDHAINDLEYAGGGGLRIKTPIGPIRFDIAFPLSESAKDLQYYLNIGEAF